MSENVRLSASRIGTAKKCSWSYWCKYHLKMPDKSNDGASRGTVCHNIFEYLGKDRHKKHFESIIKNGTVESSKAVHKLVKIQASRQDPPVDSKDNLDLMDKFIMRGLRYDFFGEESKNLDEGLSEQVFDLKVDDGGLSYHIYGFIDKLFIYDKGKKAVVRDFKTSKKKYTGSEITDNLQNLLYCLAVKKLYPNCEEFSTEFLFLNFDMSRDMLGHEGEGVMKLEPMSHDEIDGFEYQLNEIQEYLNSFGEDEATGNFAADMPFPSDGTFGGPLSCGFAKYPNQLKKDGTKMWHCPFKFAFEYWALKYKNGNTVKTVHDEEEHTLIPNEKEGEYLEKLSYKGCPRHSLKKDLDL
jgi:hypothetical protein